MDLADTHGLGRLPDDIPVHSKRLSFQHRFEKGVIILRSLGHSSRRIHLSSELLKSLATVSCRPSNSEISSECQSNAFSSSGKVIIGESQIKSLVARTDSVCPASNNLNPSGCIQKHQRSTSNRPLRKELNHSNFWLTGNQIVLYQSCCSDA